MKTTIMRSLTLCAGLSLSVPAANAGLTLASSGKPRCVVVQQAGATAPEQHAVVELVSHLNQITGARFEVQTNATEAPKSAVIVGQGALAAKLFPEVDFAKLGDEEFVIRTKGGRLLLAGGRPRGTIYAVDRFLQDQCGVRWWTPWATNIPHRATLRTPDLNLRGQPPFEYREPFWYQGFDPLWKSRNGANGENHRIPAEWGGCIRYKGFAHTFYPLVPPEQHFATHPEWYSLINGKRTHDHAQLCLSNPELRDFVVGRVKEWLRESPDAAIISVTQNDWHGQCQCDQCKAIDNAEGSPSGSLLTFVNYVAEKIDPEFPRVAVDTFAYQYTRKPPRTIKPRPNVIVRLCSIECNFREPLDHPSNASFLADIEGWSKICHRLYIWDYTTDFAAYLMPHPNWFTLGANVRLFQKYGVRGVFEQGAYQGYGNEMGELRAWVLAQLLWNPQQDDRALIKEFLEGYYGKVAAKPIGQYLQLMHDASKGFYLGCFTRQNAPHRTAKVLIEAERLWQEAEKAVTNDPELTARVRLSHLPVRFAILREWELLRHACWEQNLVWPLPESRKAVAEEFRTVAKGVPGKPWTVVHPMRESGLTVDKFLEGFAQDPPKRDFGASPPRRGTKPKPPGDVDRSVWRNAVDVQDGIARLANPGEWAEVRLDTAASDARAVWMPGSHKEWACAFVGSSLPEKVRTGRWQVYAVVRVEPTPGTKPDAVAFTAGVYDEKARKSPASLSVRLDQAGEGYHSHLLGTVDMTPDCEVYVAPGANKTTQAIWVDRVFFAPAR